MQTGESESLFGLLILSDEALLFEVFEAFAGCCGCGGDSLCFVIFVPDGLMSSLKMDNGSMTTGVGR